MLHPPLILDLDGTLADTEPLHDRAWDVVLRGVPSQAVSEQRRKWLGKSSGEIARELIAVFHLAQSEEDMLREKRRKFRELVRQGLQPFPGLAHELARWTDSAVAVATSGSRREALLVLETLRLPVHFQAVVTCDDVPRAKPAPDIYLRACELLGRNPADCFSIEDSTNGMLAAVAAGTHVLAVSAGTPESLPAGVERIFASTVEALRWLRSACPGSR